MEKRKFLYFKTQNHLPLDAKIKHRKEWGQISGQDEAKQVCCQARRARLVAWGGWPLKVVIGKSGYQAMER